MHDEPTLFDPDEVAGRPQGPGAIPADGRLGDAERDAAAAPKGPLLRVRATVAYHGGPFAGFAAQPDQRTVAGELTRGLSTVLRHRVDLVGAGRTDRGVHAHGQVVSFDAEAARFDAERLARAVNRILGPWIVVRDVAAADPGFNARFSARSRGYRYTVLNTPLPDPSQIGVVWHVAPPLDVAALRLGADPLIGTHDFSAFCRRPRLPRGAEPASLVRHVEDARWAELGDGLLRFDIRANAFCHQMVRSIVGTLVEMGRGRRRAGEMMAILRSGDRRAAGPVAPPDGLCLWEVRT